MRVVWLATFAEAQKGLFWVRLLAKLGFLARFIPFHLCLLPGFVQLIGCQRVPDNGVEGRVGEVKGADAGQQVIDAHDVVVVSVVLHVELHSLTDRPDAHCQRLRLGVELGQLRGRVVLERLLVVLPLNLTRKLAVLAGLTKYNPVPHFSLGRKTNSANIISAITRMSHLRSRS